MKTLILIQNQMYDRWCIGGMPVKFSFVIYVATNRSTKKEHTDTWERKNMIAINLISNFSNTNLKFSNCNQVFGMKKKILINTIM